MKLFITACALAISTFTYCPQVNYEQLFALKTAQQTYTPGTIAELQQLVRDAQAQSKKISIVGAGKSQGGQTMSNHADAYRINLEKINKLITINTQAKEVTVEAGMTWKQLQQYIAPLGLAIKAMQSYHDFSIGASVSVNVHGQDLATGQIMRTIKSLKIINASGELMTVTRDQNPKLFYALVGGYGLFGIIVEVTLQLTDDTLLERSCTIVNTRDFVDYFDKNIKNNPEVQFYSARFSMGSSDLLEKAFIITYKKVEGAQGSLFTLTQQNNIKSTCQRKLFELTGQWTWFKDKRFALEKLFLRGTEIVSRNNFFNRSTTELMQDTDQSQYILQEYFIPYNQVTDFINKLRKLVEIYDINLLNVTARHVLQDNESMLSFAPTQDMCAFVLYIQVNKDTHAYRQIVRWTRKVIDQALQHHGTYYLPYQLLATQEQFVAAYPRWQEFVTLKKQFDPAQMFTNRLYEKYA